jgi:hypothetical protein
MLDDRAEDSLEHVQQAAEHWCLSHLVRPLLDRRGTGRRLIRVRCVDGPL